MIFCETPLPGAYIVESQPREDERGSFAPLFIREEFEARGLDTGIAECALSFNRLAGTLRGLHYQTSPHEQAKLVRCSRGVIWDVIVDLRPESPTKHRWTSVELEAKSFRSIFVPARFAHGFVTLCDDVEVQYILSAPHEPRSERGIRWDDPALAITWPLQPIVVSKRDSDLPLLASLSD